MIDPQDHTSLEGNAPRGRILNGDSNLLHKRDRSPPKSEKYSSLPIEAKLARAETVLRAIMAEGCPSNEGMTVETALKYVELNGECRQTVCKRPSTSPVCKRNNYSKTKKDLEKTLSVHVPVPFLQRFRSPHKNAPPS